MAYLQIDDQAADHPKLAVLSDKAFRLWFSGCTYAQRFLTDGHLPAAVLPTLRGYTDKTLAELCQVIRPFDHALWSEQSDGVQIHDFLIWNHSRAEVIKRRSEKKERMQAARTNGRFHVRGTPQDGHVSGHRQDTSPERVTALNLSLSVAKATGSRASIAGRRNLHVLNDSDPVQCPSSLSEEFQSVIRPRLANGADPYSALLEWVHKVSDRTVERYGGAPAEVLGKETFAWWRKELAADWGVSSTKDAPAWCRNRHDPPCATDAICTAKYMTEMRGESA